MERPKAHTNDRMPRERAGPQLAPRAVLALASFHERNRRASATPVSSWTVLGLPRWAVAPRCFRRAPRARSDSPPSNGPSAYDGRLRI